MKAEERGREEGNPVVEVCGYLYLGDLSNKIIWANFGHVWATMFPVQLCVAIVSYPGKQARVRARVIRAKLQNYTDGQYFDNVCFLVDISPSLITDVKNTEIHKH